MENEEKEVLSAIASLRNHKDIVDKKEIQRTYKSIGDKVNQSVFLNQGDLEILLGDDTAAIPQKDGTHLLFASEGIVSGFLDQDPWFAGYSAVMVNISDICAMGGLPLAITDILHVKNEEESKEIWKGMMAASAAYGVPIVGGHTCYRVENKSLSVSIVGQATKNLLTSFNAEPGEEILLAIDHDGAYFKDYPFWNASTHSSPELLQTKARLLYEIANNKWSNTAKDVSMGGIIGTLLMLLNTSKVGADISLEQISKPKGVLWEKWLASFPSYGYLFTCKKEQVGFIKNLFNKHNIVCDAIGKIKDKKELTISYKQHKIKF